MIESLTDQIGIDIDDDIQQAQADYKRNYTITDADDELKRQLEYRKQEQLEGGTNEEEAQKAISEIYDDLRTGECIFKRIFGAAAKLYDLQRNNYPNFGSKTLIKVSQ